MVTARRDSRCGGCDTEIREGDQIGMVDGEWVCADCVEAYGGEDGDGDG